MCILYTTGFDYASGYFLMILIILDGYKFNMRVSIFITQYCKIAFLRNGCYN